MNKPVLLAAVLGLTGAAGMALAQPAPPPPATPPAAPQVQAPAPPPPPGPGPRGPGMAGPEGGPGMHGPMMMEAYGPMRGWHRPPPPSRAASFYFQRDDAEIHIQCAEGESTRACVDAASVLLDKVGALPNR